MGVEYAGLDCLQHPRTVGRGLPCPPHSQPKQPAFEPFAAPEFLPRKARDRRDSDVTPSPSRGSDDSSQGHPRDRAGTRLFGRPPGGLGERLLPPGTPPRETSRRGPSTAASDKSLTSQLFPNMVSPLGIGPVSEGRNSPSAAEKKPFQKADGVGFEPTNDFRRCRFSRPVHSTALPPIPTAAVSPRPRTSVARACRRTCRRRSLASLPPPSAGGPDTPPGIPPASVPQGSPLTNRPIWPKTVILTPGSRVDFPARGTPCPRRPLRDRTPTPHEHPTGPAISWAASATG